MPSFHLPSPLAFFPFTDHMINNKLNIISIFRFSFLLVLFEKSEIHHFSYFSSKACCHVSNDSRTDFSENNTAKQRETERGRERRRKCFNPPQGSSERWAPPLSEALGLSVTAPYLVPTHSLFALYKLQNCLCLSVNNRISSRVLFVFQSHPLIL